MSTTATVVIIIGVVVVVAILAWSFLRKQRSKRLMSQFGPEYNHAIDEYGDRARAENALMARQKRRERLQIHSLPQSEREKFADRWTQVQSEFVDDPSGSIQDADLLVSEAMVARGYPMLEFENRAEDLSVDYPHVVRNYRAAHQIALSREEGRATTEDLRQALVYYRDLFDELLEEHVTARKEAR